MPYATTNELRADALFRAGEPQSSASKYWDKSLDYLNRTMHALLLGGGIAVGRDLATSAGIYAHIVDIPIVDWLWARKQPRGVIQTQARILGGTATLIEASANVVLSATVSTSMAGWRIKFQGHPIVPRISTHTGGTNAVVLDAVWPRTTTSAVWEAFQLEYDLAADFLRFAGSPVMHSDYYGPIPVVGREDVEAWSATQYAVGPPSSVALLTPTRILLDTYDTLPNRLEYDYLASPTLLTAGSTPTLPVHHRAVLSIGAAMLISHDKSDANAKTLASEFREMVQRMVQENRKALSSGSRRFAQYLTRPAGRGLRGAQRMGEIFLR